MRDQEYKALPDGQLRREKKYFKKEKMRRTFIKSNSSKAIVCKDELTNKSGTLVERNSETGRST